MSNHGLTYEVKVTGASAGAADIAKLATAAKQTGDATAKAAPATKSLGEALASLGGRNNSAKDVLEGIITAARGGEGAVFGLAKAFKAFRELLNGGFAALGPGGILVAGLGVVVGLLPKFIELIKGSDAAAKTLEETTREAVVAAEDLGAVRLQQLKAQFKDVDEAAASARKQFDAALSALERIDNARKSAALAENRARSDISEAQKKANEDAINQTFDNRERARKIAPFVQNVEDAKSAVANAQDFSDEASANYRGRRDELARLTASQAERESLKRQISGPIPIDDPEAAARYGEAAKRLSELPDRSSEIEALNAEVSGLGKVAEAAAAKLGDAQKKLEEASTAYDFERQLQADETTSANRVQKAKRLGDLQARKSGLESARADAAQAAETAAAAGDSAGQDEAVASLRKFDDELRQVNLEVKPLADAVKASAGSVNTFAASSERAIAAAAKAIAEQAAHVPPAVDLSPLATAQTSYHEANQARHAKTAEAIASLQRMIERMAAQLANQRS